MFQKYYAAAKHCFINLTVVDSAKKLAKNESFYFAELL